MKKLLIPAIVLLVLVLGGVGISLIRSQTAAAAAAQNAPDTTTVERGEITVSVVETGMLEAVKTVEVKSRVAGRLAQLLVEEGDRVTRGQLIAVIDPQETELQVRQSRAQLQGAKSAYERAQVELQQRAVTVQTQLERAQSRLASLRKENEAQPALTGANIAAAEAGYRSARQSLEMLTTVTQPNEREAVEKEVADSRQSLLTAEREHQRRSSLLERGYVSLRDLENARLELEVARTRAANASAKLNRLGAEHALQTQQAQERLREAEAALTSARTNRISVGLKEEQLRQAEIDLREAQAARKDLESMRASSRQQAASVEQIQTALDDSLRLLGETEIRSPIDGIVTRRLVQEGELVASLSSFSAGTTIVRIEDRTRMTVQLQINEIDVAKLRLGMPAKVELDAFPGREFEGVVSRIAPASVALSQQQLVEGAGANDPVVRYHVEVEVTSTIQGLKSGMSARCTMTVVSLQDVPRVPVDFVGEDRANRNRFVMRLPEEVQPGQQPEPERVQVEVGESTGAFVHIRSGVEVGDRLQRPEFDGPARQGVMQFGPDDAPEEEEPGAEGAGAQAQGESR